MNAALAWLAESPLATATWVDYLDIGLLTFGLYRLLMLLRGTRAMQSLFGLMLVGALYFVSRVFSLTTTTWVLDNFFVYAVLGLIILFQQDLRRALARAGGTFFQRLTITPSDANVMEEVIKAVFALAHRKIGALIVLERLGSMDQYTEGASTLDAEVSASLLQSIFHPSSPMHDGAVVIAKNRVVAAGVFLPISMNKDISRIFGTRHRAAIGLTEVMDGIALVVSEERGTVSLVHKGEVTPIVDANDLRQRLVERIEATHAAEATAAGATVA